MRKSVKIALIIAAVCILIGVLLSGAAFAAAGFDLARLSTVEIKSGEIDITETFSRIDIDVSDTNVHFLPAEDGVCKIVYQSANDVRAEVREDGTLAVESFDGDSRPSIWIDLSFAKRYIKIYLPRDEYENLSVKTDSGDIYVFPVFNQVQNAVLDSTSGNVSFIGTATESLSVKTVSGDILVREPDAKTVRAVSTSGDITFSAVYAINVYAETTSGDVEFMWVNATEQVTVSSVSGDLDLECDAAKLSLKTVSGNVEGTISTAKKYITKTTSGTVKLPPSDNTAGICEITTTSGNIHIREIPVVNNPHAGETTIYGG